MTRVEYFICILGIGMCIGCAITRLTFRPEINALRNKIAAVEYLDKYHCYLVTCKTTQYTTDPKECSKNKKLRMFGITSSGRKAIKDRTVAVDTNNITEGSTLIDVQTGKKYDADDTGNMVKGWHVDYFIGEGTPENVKKAQKYGVQYRQFVVIEPGRN